MLRGLLVVVLLVGGITSLVGGVMLLVAAFRTGVGWGLAVLFLPVAGLVFVFMYWPEARKPFLIQCLGTVLVVLGMLGGAGMGLAEAPSTLSAALQQQGLVEEAPPVEDTPDIGVPVPEDDGGIESLFAESDDLMGKSISDVVAERGRPEGRVQQGRRVVLMYPDCIISSSDGVTVDGVEFKDGLEDAGVR